jgi:hypothetical protein
MSQTLLAVTNQNVYPALEQTYGYPEIDPFENVELGINLV